MAIRPHLALVIRDGHYQPKINKHGNNYGHLEQSSHKARGEDGSILDEQMSKERRNFGGNFSRTCRRTNRDTNGRSNNL